MYYDYAMAAPLMAGVNQKPEIDVLILGMEAGTYATQCKRYFDYVYTADVGRTTNRELFASSTPQMLNTLDAAGLIDML